MRIHLRIEQETNKKKLERGTHLPLQRAQMHYEIWRALLPSLSLLPEIQKYTNPITYFTQRTIQKCSTRRTTTMKTGDITLSHSVTD